MNNRIKWHGQVLTMNKYLNPREGFEHGTQRKCPRGRPKLRWKQQVRKDVTQNEGRTWKETEEGSFGKIETLDC
jgi:hypothetical protein